MHGRWRSLFMALALMALLAVPQQAVASPGHRDVRGTVTVSPSGARAGHFGLVQASADANSATVGPYHVEIQRQVDPIVAAAIVARCAEYRDPRLQGVFGWVVDLAPEESAAGAAWRLWQPRFDLSDPDPTALDVPGQAIVVFFGGSLDRGCASAPVLGASSGAGEVPAGATQAVVVAYPLFALAYTVFGVGAMAWTPALQRFTLRLCAPDAPAQCEQ